MRAMLSIETLRSDPRPMVKLERCWPWLERRGLQSTAKCSSAAPEACAVGGYRNAGQSFHATLV